MWLDGLVVFYPIFKWLEQNAPDSILPIEFHRRDAFEEDIQFYSELLGLNWREKCEETRPSVEAYLKHMNAIQAEDPLLLWAYVYHLYMGLLSGGQILQKKRRLANKFSPFADDGDLDLGYRVTSFADQTVGQLKMQMRQQVDTAALCFDEHLQERLIEESSKLFELNNGLVRSVRGVQSASIKKLGITAAVCLAIWAAFKWTKAGNLAYPHEWFSS